MPRTLRASMAIAAALVLAVILGVAALVLDVGYAWTVRARLQNAVDAAAHAAVMELDGTADGLEAALAEAQAIAAANPVLPGQGLVLAEEDVHFGTWDAETGEFIESDDPSEVDAVRIEVAVPDIELGLLRAAFGASGLSVRARSTAFAGAGDASTGDSGGPGLLNGHFDVDTSCFVAEWNCNSGGKPSCPATADDDEDSASDDDGDSDGDSDSDDDSDSSGSGRDDRDHSHGDDRHGKGRSCAAGDDDEDSSSDSDGGDDDEDSSSDSDGGGDDDSDSSGSGGGGTCAIDSTGCGTNAHVHEYDDEYDVTEYDAFSPEASKLLPVDDAVEEGQPFKIIVANADLSPSAVLVINGEGHPVTEYDDTPLEDLEVYVLGGGSGYTELDTLAIAFDDDTIKSCGLHPTVTGHVRKNVPGPNNEWRNGALTVQLVAVDASSGDDAFETETSYSAGGVQGVAICGLLWEATFFWHWDGPAYDEADWEDAFEDLRCSLPHLVE